MLSRLFGNKSVKRHARAIYDQLSLAARDPNLYGLDRVPDTPDGRFELLALHASVVFARLSKRGEQAEETSQEVFNILFSALDHALRELGVGDLSVGKRIRKLAESFYGRMAVYHGALQLEGEEEIQVLAAAIGVHVLDQPTHPSAFASVLATRIRDWALDLEGTDDETLLRGNVPLPR
jgi:cytochrome b pre-mRNA-processing protein 3